MKPTIGFNHLFIDSGKLTGPGVYAVQLLQNIASLSPEHLASFQLKVFAQSDTRHHYSEALQGFIFETPKLKGRFRRVLWEQFCLPFVTRREGVDILFSPAFVSPLFGAPLKAVVIHDMYYRIVPEAVERFQRLYWRAMIPLTCWASDLILTVSSSSRRDIIKYLPQSRGKVKMIPLASRFGTGAQPDAPPLTGRPYVLIIANLTPNKNVTRLVEALSLLLQAGRDIDLVHIGSDLRGELTGATERFGVEAHVRSLGNVDDEKLISVARNALCVAVPSLYEGFGMPAIEAQALGAPLICSDRGALPEVAGKAALIFDPEDASAIATQVARLLDDPEMRNVLRAAGYANARGFSWERTASLTIEAFEKLLMTKSKIPITS